MCHYCQFVSSSNKAEVDGFYIYYRPYGSARSAENHRRTAPAGPRSQYMMLSGLVPDTAYSIRMAAYNRHGVSDYSNTAVQKTLSMSTLMVFYSFPGIFRTGRSDVKEQIETFAKMFHVPEETFLQTFQIRLQ